MLVLKVVKGHSLRIGPITVTVDVYHNDKGKRGPRLHWFIDAPRDMKIERLNHDARKSDNSGAAGQEDSPGDVQT